MNLPLINKIISPSNQQTLNIIINSLMLRKYDMYVMYIPFLSAQHVLPDNPHPRPYQQQKELRFIIIYYDYSFTIKCVNPRADTDVIVIEYFLFAFKFSTQTVIHCSHSKAL